MKYYWEGVADKLSKCGWSWGCISAIDANGQTIWIVDAHRGDGKRFIVRSDEKLTALLELERITNRLAVSALLEDNSNASLHPAELLDDRSTRPK